MRKLSIGVRLALWYFGIFAVAQLVFVAGMWYALQYHLYDLLDDRLEDQVDDLKNFITAQKPPAAVDKLREDVAAAYALEHSGDYLEIYAGNALLYRSPFLEKHAVALASGASDGAVYKSLRIDGLPYRFMRQTLAIDGHFYSATTGLPADDVAETLSLFRSSLLMFAPLLFLVAAGGGYWLSRRALAPVDALVLTARDIGGANLSRRVARLETGDELQRLSDTLNDMLARIEATFQRVAEFTADASHELRTPIALIRTEAELSLRRSRGEIEYRDALRHILLEAERTTSLIEQLLSLARADSGRETLNMQPVDVCQTLRGVAEGWQAVAGMRNLQFSQDMVERDLFVLGEEGVLRRLANILLDNAFKYTPSPGWVRLSVEHNGGKVAISVQDSGVGIAEEEQAKIFERFYRVDKARSRAQGGAGLGLAMAKWIVAQHRGSITVESSPGKGATFRVELPLIATPVSSPQPV